MWLVETFMMRRLFCPTRSDSRVQAAIHFVRRNSSPTTDLIEARELTDDSGLSLLLGAFWTNPVPKIPSGERIAGENGYEGHRISACPSAMRRSHPRFVI